MEKSIKDLNKFASEELGFEVEFEESIIQSPEEIEEAVEKNPETDMLVHATTHLETDDNIILITTDFPEYKPWALLVQDEEGEVKSLKFFDDDVK